MTEQLTYKEAGVDIDTADAAKQQMAKSLEGGATTDARVLNRTGAFASLFEGRFPGVDNAILVFKSEEPGSKQLLAFQFDRVEGICHDLINHLINDIVVMGSEPVAVLDTIVCGKLEKDVVVRLVDTMAQSCREHSCTLVGGETSEQPGVLKEGRYVLCATAMGVVDKSKIIDGSAIQEGDVVLALASNGPHTNGYTLIRKLIEQDEALLSRDVAGESFLDHIMRPHRSYLRFLRPLFKEHTIHGLAHITGGGVEDNLARILPKGLAAKIDVSTYKVPEIFHVIQEQGNVPAEDMLRTFNMGVGIALVASEDEAPVIQESLVELGCDAYPIGKIVKGKQTVELRGNITK